METRTEIRISFHRLLMKDDTVSDGNSSREFSEGVEHDLVRDSLNHWIAATSDYSELLLN